VALLREHRGPLTADLHRFHGLVVSRLSECGLPLRDVAAIVAHLPEESATFRALNPHWEHTHSLELLRRIEYHQAIAVWFRTRDGERGVNPPEPFRFPWEPEPETPGAYRGDRMTTDEADEFLGWGHLRAV